MASSSPSSATDLLGSPLDEVAALVVLGLNLDGGVADVAPVAQHLAGTIEHGVRVITDLDHEVDAHRVHARGDGQHVQSCASMTPSSSSRSLTTLSTSMWAAATRPGCAESRRSLYARGRMNRPMPMAITESTQYQEVNAMMPAPMSTPTDPTASATT